MFNVSSTRRLDLADPRVRGELQVWVPERFLRAAEAVQSSGLVQQQQQQQPEGEGEGEGEGEAALLMRDRDPPTLYVGSDVDVCRVCHVDSVGDS